MGKKAKAKPRRLWVVLTPTGRVDSTHLTKAAAEKRAWSPRDSIIELVAVTPRKRQKGKK